jgi:hypothetical protein
MERGITKLQKLDAAPEEFLGKVRDRNQMNFFEIMSQMSQQFARQK